MELKDLVGKHLLSGVDMGTGGLLDEDVEYSNYIKFILDKVTYIAIEDPSDGYRSCMKEIRISPSSVTNTFTPIEVLGVLPELSNEDILKLYDTQNGKLIIEVGTNNMDDYYPLFVGNFNPENMSINRRRINRKNIKKR